MKQKKGKNASFSEAALEEMSGPFELVESMVENITAVLRDQDMTAAAAVVETETSINQLELSLIHI